MCVSVLGSEGFYTARGVLSRFNVQSERTEKEKIFFSHIQKKKPKNHVTENERT